MNDFRFSARTEPRTDRARPLATQAWFTVEPRDAAVASARTALPVRTFNESDCPLSHLVSELVAQVDAADPSQAGHSLRVAALATMLGSSIGMNARELRDLRIAAMLHDVGKILVPAEALRKEGPLSATETSAVRRHAVFGGMILRKIPALAFAAPVARWHHERWDGLGYPDGIQGASIPLHARVVAVADALDAMVSVRPYRRAMGLQDAFAELDAQSGAQFDPLVVSATGPLVGAPGFEDSVNVIAHDIEVLPAAA
jgi:HD-GYP domain-containing protein (c-di-GMP phosphodiesterase class II)